MHDERYARQLPLPQVGAAGQEKLAAASAVVLGAGGLGTPVLQYLAAAGLGRLHIVDGDVVSPSNLNRQVLYTQADLGKPKATLAARHLQRLNPQTQIHASAVMLTEDNAKALLAGHSLVIMCLDSVAARITANRAAMQLGLPVLEGAVQAFSGHILLGLPGQSACYECVYGQVAPKQKPVYVLGAMAGAVGSLMALTALKFLLGMDAGAGKLVLVDGLDLHTEALDVRQNPACSACAHTGRDS